jgi:hypothetical protein
VVIRIVNVRSEVFPGALTTVPLRKTVIIPSESGSGNENENENACRRETTSRIVFGAVWKGDWGRLLLSHHRISHHKNLARLFILFLPIRRCVAMIAMTLSWNSPGRPPTITGILMPSMDAPKECAIQSGLKR